MDCHGPNGVKASTLRQPWLVIARAVLFGLLLGGTVPYVAWGQTESWIDNPLTAGPPKLPRWVIEECLRSPSLPHATCLALMGWPPGREAIPIPESPRCQLSACRFIPPAQWEILHAPINGREIPVQYATWFNLESGMRHSDDWLLRARSELRLVNVRNAIDYEVRSQLPARSCELETRLENVKEAAAGNEYSYETVVRADLRACFDVPCAPNFWETCTVKDDLGTVRSTLSVRMRVDVDAEKLRVNVGSQFRPGELSAKMKALFSIEDIFNSATGQIFRSGQQRKYDEAINNAIQAAVAQTGEKLSQRVSVPGARQFKPTVDAARLEIDASKGLRMFVDIKAQIPAPLVCDTRAALIDMNQYKCDINRGR